MLIIVLLAVESVGNEGEDEDINIMSDKLKLNETTFAMQDHFHIEPFKSPGYIKKLAGLPKSRIIICYRRN